MVKKKQNSNQAAMDEIRNNFLALQHGALPLAFYREPFFTISLLAASPREALKRIHNAYFPNTGLNFDSYFAPILGNKETPFQVYTIPLVHNGVEVIAQTIAWPFYNISVQPLITAFLLSSDKEIKAVYEYVLDLNNQSRVVNHIIQKSENSINVEPITNPIFFTGQGEQTFNVNNYQDVILPGLFHMLKCNPDGTPLTYEMENKKDSYKTIVESPNEENDEENPDNIILFSPTDN